MEMVVPSGAASDISQGHHYTQTMEQGVASAVKAGMDIVCGIPMPDVKVENAAILQAVKDGLLSTEDVDRSVRRLFTARFKLGMFDPPSMVPYHPAASENDSAPHRELALTAARESLVLLKNSDGVLPLGTKYKTIAVIGPNADSVDPLLGNYNGTPTHPVTVLGGMRKRFGDAHVLYAAGSSLTGQPLSPVPSSALRTASGEGGLSAEYFVGTDLQGKPADTRTDLSVDFSWQKGINSEMSDNFSVRWTGSLVPPVTGDYQIGFTGTDAFHMWLDNQLIGESQYSDTSKTRIKTVHLEAGHAYPIKIECSQKGSSGLAKLVWHEPGDKKDYTDAVSKADLIVAVVGLAGELEGEEMPINVEGFSGGDRTSLDLPGAQRELLKDLVASGKPVVVVLMNGSALAVNWADEHAKAILEAWYPGEQGGVAVAEALAGDFSPGGRLPLTFYKSVDQLPAFDDYKMKGRTYRYFTGEPLYPFGYGLSYTNFEYSNLHFEKDSLGANDNLTAGVDVKNTGKMAADEVVEVYVTHPGVEGAPVRALAGFKRVHVASGATEHVQITVPNRQLSVVDGDGTRKIVAGDLQLWVGGGQPVTRDGLAKAAGVEGSVKITGEAVLPK
jgi:beta-glucosidase